MTGHFLTEVKLATMIVLQPRTATMNATRALVTILTSVFLALGPSASAQTCGPTGVGVQVLGSGGPRVKGRASTSYLVWLGSHGQILVDAGGGAFLRFGQAGGRLEDLSLIAISHLHPDHVSDLPALLWQNTQARKTPLPIVGPSGNDAVPSFDTFLSRLFDGKNGAFQVLGGTLGGAGEGVPLDITVIDVARAESSIVLDKAGVRVTALGVPHANIPSLAYRVETAGTSVVLGSDQTGTNPKFVEFARNADVLVMHLAVGPGVTSPFHAAPDVVGRIARDAAARRLVLSHIGQFDIDAAVAEVKKHYAGPITVAEDLQCTPAR
jgi:ribonuclease BN (tRNA processing enzyme)